MDPSTSEAMLENPSRRAWTGFAHLGSALPRSTWSAKLQALLFLGLVLVATFFYQSTPASELILCPLRAGTGMQCAGCGMTRSWCAISAGDFDLAVVFNPFGPVLYTMAVLKALFLAVEVGRRRRLVLPWWERARSPVMGTIAVAMMLFSGYRAWEFFAGP